MAVVGLAFAVSSLLRGALWAFFIAKNVSAFQALLVGGVNPFLLFYPTIAVVALPLVWLTLIGADARAFRRSAVSYGLWVALLVAVFQAAHMRFWYGEAACTPNATFLTDILSDGCFFNYGGLDFIVMPLLAFLATVVFGNPRPASLALRRLHLLERRGAASAAIVALACGWVWWSVPPARAAEVTIGFRADVEPFSYKVNQDGGKQAGKQPLYKGFLADLCYWISTAATFPSSRKKSRRATASGLQDRRIDVLCDPVTMRFSEETRARSGTFSPIVFATGISYLQWRQRKARSSVFIGYVENSTAARVLQHVCEIDLFGKVPPDERGDLATMCQTAEARRSALSRSSIASLRCRSFLPIETMQVNSLRPGMGPGSSGGPGDRLGEGSRRGGDRGEA